MRRLLDRVTGTLTMYKLVLVALTAITAIAITLSLLGQLRFSPLELIASAAVLVTATCATSLLAGRVLRGPAHLDSSFITALLLFFIMQPKLDVPGLLSLALAGVIASASKYVLAVRGRHIFNPAASGAFVVTLLAFGAVESFSYAQWWVGTPYLLVPVAIGAFLVLYRTQKLAMGGVFIAVALLIQGVRYALAGTPVVDAVSDTLLSSPAVFLVGFMLSEPLTLPPRRWQQLAEAALVALLMFVPFSLGTLISSTPQLALLVGNLLAFLVGQRRGIRMTYLGKQQLGESTWELSFQPSRPVRFSPGQYMELTIPHRSTDFRGSRRIFSVASAPSDDGPITFAITRPATTSSFKQALLDLEPGAVVHGTSVGGDFVLPKDAGQPLLLVAGGIGITPFASQLAHATKRGEQRDVVVAYATSTPGSLPYAALLEQSGARVVLFTPEAPSSLPAGWQYGGAGRVTGQRLAEAIPDIAARRTYVSGPPALVHDLRRALRSQGAKRVHADSFSGY